VRKLLILVPILFLSFKSFSQNDTLVKLQIPVAKLVITDLIEGDAAKEQLYLTEEQIEVLQEKIVLQDSIITNYEKVINTQSQQLNISQDLSTRLEADLKKQKVKTKLTGGIGAALLVGLALIL
jgi:hypothetical protein